MKHIISIHLIIILFSGICAYALFYQPSEIKDPALTVNSKIFSSSEIKDSISSKPFYQTKEQHVNQIIEKELMVQEAIKEKINQDKEFQRKIKSFYENNLIQMLIKKKTEEFRKAPIEDNIIKKYMDISGSTVVIKNITTGQIINRKTFDELSENIKYEFLMNSKNKIKKEINKKNYLFSIVPETKRAIDKETARKDIIGIRNRYMWNVWLESIRKNAKIELNKDIYGED